MLKPYRRHNKAICALPPSKRNCTCPIWVRGVLNGKPIKQAVGSRMWVEAEKIIESWQEDPQAKEQKDRASLPIEHAIKKYLTSCRTEKNVADSTYKSYSKTLNHFLIFTNEQCGITGLGAVEPTHIRDFIAWRAENGREAGKGCTPRTRVKELEHIRFLFNYCIENQWIGLNPAKKVKVKVPEGGGYQPLTDEEMATLLHAADTIKNNNAKWVERARLRMRAAILTMAYTGLRVSDIATLKRSQVRSDGSTDHVMVKTKRLLWTRLGEAALGALMALPDKGEYFFWSGPEESKLSTQTGTIRRSLASLGRRTGISVHPHRFRDTFALKVMEEVGDIRVLQELLGHKSIKTTEKHYLFPGQKQRMRLTDALSTIEYGKRDGTTGQLITLPKPRSRR